MRLGTFALAALVATTATAPARATPATAVATTPRQALAVFYDWYIARTRSDHDPGFELSSEVPGLVTAALRARLDAQLQAGEVPGRDYFLRCPDTWRPTRRVEVLRIVVTTPGPGAPRAAADVRLHAEGGARWRAHVSLVKEGSAWRIASVDDAPGR